MKYLWVILFLTASLYACKNKPSGHPSNQASVSTDSTKFYPLADFINEQIAFVDLRNFIIYQKKSNTSKSDSSIINKEQFKAIAANFLAFDISKPDKKQSYTETIFHDLSTASYTINYKTNQASLLVKSMDILLDEQTKLAKRVFIVSERQSADSSIMEKHSWTANKQFQITRTIVSDSGSTNETTTVYWIRK
jgi:hypothetical protein